MKNLPNVTSVKEREGKEQGSVNFKKKHDRLCVASQVIFRKEWVGSQGLNVLNNDRSTGGKEGETTRWRWVLILAEKGNPGAEERPGEVAAGSTIHCSPSSIADC